MTHPPGTRLCACGCKDPLTGYRPDAKWRTRACVERWARANPSKSRREARVEIVGRTKPARRSGVSLRIGARPAVAAVAAVLITEYGETPSVARARVRLALRPLVNPRHRSLL